MLAGRVGTVYVTGKLCDLLCLVLDGLKAMSKGIWGNHVFTQRYVERLYMPSDSDETMNKTEKALAFMKHVFQGAWTKTEKIIV